MHHGIWKELLTAINQNSPETHNEGGKKWFFPSAVSKASHTEWTVRQILVHLDLFFTPRRLYAASEIAEFQVLKLDTILSEAEITTLFACRPDGVAFNAKDKERDFLEFTRPMDCVTSSDEGDRAERKESEKDTRYLTSRASVAQLVGARNC